MTRIFTKFCVEETAMDLIRDKGDFTLDEVAAKHEATLHQLLEMVGGKDRLLEELGEFNGAAILVDCRQVADSDAPVPERVHDFLYALVETHTNLTPFPARPGRTDELRRECRGLLRDLLLEGVVDRCLACGDPEEAADLALDAVERFHTWGTSWPSRHMIERGVDPGAYFADPRRAMMMNEVAFNRLWIVLRPALGIQDATKAEMRIAQDLARLMRDLRPAQAA